MTTYKTKYGKRHQRTASHYTIRKSALSFLGFDSYAAYLESALWTRVRSAVLERDGGLCVLCGKPAYTAHHITYSVVVLRGERLDQLISVCKGCHKAVEFKGGKKLMTAGTVHQAVVFRSEKHGGQLHERKMRLKIRPMCRCCHGTFKHLGRNDICLGCYKRYREKVYEVIAGHENAAVARDATEKG